MDNPNSEFNFAAGPDRIADCSHAKRRLRVALFTDSYGEANGVGTFCREYADFAKRAGYHLLVAYGGDQTRVRTEGSLTELELRRGPASFGLDAGLRFDPFLVRHRRRVVAALLAFRPDLVHFTGPGDVSILGLWASNLVGVPAVAIWHTNVHEYAFLRLNSFLSVLPEKIRRYASTGAMRATLWATARFYRVAHFVAAPNQGMVDLLACRTGRPAFLITHGVDTELFKPERRYRTDRTFRIGYVGRLTPEKNVRTLANLERKMEMAGATDYRFVLVGNGSERDWLQSHLARAHFTGVLRGTELAAAFANFDAFVFPSQTDTFGLVVLEAMAAGVPVVALPEAGRRAGVVDHVNGLLSNDFAPSILELMWHPAERLRLGEAARHWACECAWTRAFEDLYRVYDEGLNSGDVRRRWSPPRFTPVNGGPNYA